eukprot:jgi/Phyca11/20184/fgenesh1_pg.PHYCAscaffold_59_\
MTDLITTDEVLFDDIVGLLDSSEPLTPRAFEDESTDPAVVFTAPAPGHNAVQASTNPTDGAKTDKQKQKRELEKTRQRRYRQKMKDIRDELQQQVDELTQELHQFTQRKFRKTQLKAPHSFDKTCEALWRVIHEQEEPTFGDYVIAPDDDVFVKSRVLWSLNVGQLRQRFISRFYKEKDRLIFIWKMSSEGEGAFSGLHAEETAWMIVRPTATGVMLE